MAVPATCKDDNFKIECDMNMMNFEFFIRGIVYDAIGYSHDSEA